ncbi:MAG TPA: potassium channel family protein [Blastocatellia bacterium]|jgi:hypothetical protein|nr:potassium channel family protein [Blastocatellia bacterium]
MTNALQGIYRSWKGEFTLIRDIAKSRYPASVGAQYELSYLERAVMIILVFARSLSLSHAGGAFRGYAARSHFSESYVLGWLCLLSSMLAIWPNGAVAATLATYRIADSFCYRLCVLFVDRYKSAWGLRSVNRAIILAIINYLELVVGFAIIYAWSGSVSNSTTCRVLSGSVEALYFSCVTATTVGYGDYTPNNHLGQALVVAEILMAVLLLALVLGALLTGVRDIQPLRKDDDA